MMAFMETMTKHLKKDIRLIGKFVEVYCAGRHGSTRRNRFPLPGRLGERRLCSDCYEFMAYAMAKRMKCPLESEKPSCKACQIHCYTADQREKVREIMAYSGRKLMLRGRLDYVWHYFF
jgi:hypothetical protein